MQRLFLAVSKDNAIQTSRDGNAEGAGPDTLSISPVTGGAPGRSLKRLPSLQDLISSMQLYYS